MTESESDGEISEADEIKDNEIWTTIEDDVRELVGEAADVRIFEQSDGTVELSVLPKETANELENRHEELSVFAHESFQMIISSDE
mgnify:CR=1 FL=1